MLSSKWPVWLVTIQHRNLQPNLALKLARMCTKTHTNGFLYKLSCDALKSVVFSSKQPTLSAKP